MRDFYFIDAAQILHSRHFGIVALPAKRMLIPVHVAANTSWDSGGTETTPHQFLSTDVLADAQDAPPTDK
jgi:hypothetical protein